jgi:alpha-glucosidase
MTLESTTESTAAGRNASTGAAAAAAAETTTVTGQEWWRSAVIYQIYPRSFADATGDGIGDLQGITQHLPEIAGLGVDAIWLSPFYRSPQKDAGYDVADYCDVDPLFGSLEDFDRLLATAHELGLRVIVDIVPNHSSDANVWFQEALAAAPGSEERARYMFRDGAGPDGTEPPNNWQSVFGGPAWTRITEADGTPGQWYLHLFDASQPDFDWNNEWVRARFREILRFWLDRGVDGFRVDVAHGLVKEDGLPHYTPPENAGSMGGGIAPTAADAPGGEEGVALEPAISDEAGEATPPYWAQEGVHDIWRDWRRVVDEYEGDRILTAEAWVEPISKLALWVRPDEMHQSFNFPYLEAPWSARVIRRIIDDSLNSFGNVGAPATWVLSNHDVVRHASRLGVTAENPQGSGLGPKSKGLPDTATGLRRARAATALMLALPGSAYVYQGEELGLPEAIHLPDEARQDPTWFRTNGEKYGRDGCRVPLPWESGKPAFGFSETGASWLPQPQEWAAYARDLQAGNPDSTLEFYRRALTVRRELDLGHGTLEWLDGYPDDTVAFRNGSLTVIANMGTVPVELPPAGERVVASQPFQGAALPPETTVWLRD